MRFHPDRLSFLYPCIAAGMHADEDIHTAHLPGSPVGDDYACLDSVRVGVGASRKPPVASRIADSVGITRSVIVNALRKFESAGVIESRSSGMKGTYIKVVNDVVFEELEKLKKA